MPTITTSNLSAKSQVSDSIEYSSGTRSVVQRRVSVIRDAVALAYDDPPSER